MANTLTAIAPTIYEALDTVSRELVGFIPAVRRDSNTERAAKDQTITIPTTASESAIDVSPGTTAPDDGDFTQGSTSMTIDKSRAVPIRFNGEETRLLSTGDTPQYRDVLRYRIEQALRVLTNEIEADLAAEHVNASRAYGTAGTTPFAAAGEMDDFSETLRILKENGAPQSDLHMILSNVSAAKLLGFQSTLFKVNESGSERTLRDAIIGRVQGMMVGESGQVETHTAGTEASATTDATGYAVGSTSIDLAAAGTGTILAGDVITFDGVAGQYVVKTGTTDVDGGTIVLQEPGLIEAIPASTTAVTVVGGERNMAFDRNAIVLAQRLPALPEGGDMADDRMTISDPVTGLNFEFSVYRQYRQVYWEIAAAWGTKTVTPRHVALLLG